MTPRRRQQGRKTPLTSRFGRDRRRRLAKRRRRRTRYPFSAPWPIVLADRKPRVRLAAVRCRQRLHDVLFEMAYMNRLVVLGVLLALGQTASASAAPVTVTGPTALALASVVAQHSPLLSADDRGAMARLFGGDSQVVPIKKLLSVTADSVLCRVSNIDIASRHCELAFKTGKLTLMGREANEMSATLAAAGVPVEGAAGSMIESVSQLACTIDSNEIRQMAGAGVKCTFETAQ
jgi:hypothetical protein